MSKRIKLLTSLILVIVLTTTFFLFLSEDEITYYQTVNEAIKDPQSFQGETIRIMGLVKKDSVNWDSQKLTLSFEITEDNQNFLAVKFQGAKPDMFKEGQGVVAEGNFYDTNEFNADQLLVKHSEEYSVEQHNQDKEQYIQHLQNIN